MSLNKYTLDRFEGDYAIFFKRPEETEQLLIHRSEISVEVKEGDIVQIKDNGEIYEIEVLKDETAAKKKSVKNLLEELKNKNRD